MNPLAAIAEQALGKLRQEKIGERVELDSVEQNALRWEIDTLRERVANLTAAFEAMGKQHRKEHGR